MERRGSEVPVPWASLLTCFSALPGLLATDLFRPLAPTPPSTTKPISTVTVHFLLQPLLESGDTKPSILTLPGWVSPPFWFLTGEKHNCPKTLNNPTQPESITTQKSSFSVEGRRMDKN